MIKSIIEKIYNLPCWSVKQGHGSFLTFEFGEPHLKIVEPRPAEGITSQKVRRDFSNRKVIVHGDWHLWIYCCFWKMYFNDKLVANDNTSRRGISRALKILDGQKLIDIRIDANSGNTTFVFDLGGKLVTSGYKDDTCEQWMLYEPQGNVLSVSNNGTYSYHSSDTPVDQEVWNKIV